MKKFILILTLAMLCMGASCNQKNIRPIPIKPIPAASLSDLTNIVVKTNLNLINNKGESVQIPVITTNSKDPEFFVIIAPENIEQKTKLFSAPTTEQLKKALEPKKETPKKTFWEKYKGLAMYYGFIIFLGGVIWYFWDNLFKKNKKIKSKLVQTGNYQSVSTGGSSTTPSPKGTSEPTGASAGVVPFDLGAGASAAGFSGAGASGASGSNS